MLDHIILDQPGNDAVQPFALNGRGGTGCIPVVTLLARFPLPASQSRLGDAERKRNHRKGLPVVHITLPCLAPDLVIRRHCYTPNFCLIDAVMSDTVTPTTPPATEP